LSTNGSWDPARSTEHPLAGDVNARHQEQLSPIEKTCKRIADATGAPIALILAIILQFCWIGVGIATKFDPFPFVFLLTCSNVLQLILIFVIAVAQRQSSQHDELRAESDHDSISRLLYHQELQEALLLAIGEKLGIDTTEFANSAKSLATT
jgi:uncharacterized membrane protein